MFLPFIPKAIYDKTNIFRIQGTIIWYWLLFTTFVIRHVPYIGWWRYVRENSLIIKIWSCFINSLLGHSWIVINFVHYWNITICQVKELQGKEKILISTQHLYNDLLSWMYFTDLVNLVLVGILRYSADDMIAWITLCIRKSLLIPMKYPSILVSFTLNRPMFLLWNYWYLDLNM